MGKDRFGRKRTDCDRHPRKGDAIIRTSPKGQGFEGPCTQHYDEENAQQAKKAR